MLHMQNPFLATETSHHATLPKQKLESCAYLTFEAQCGQWPVSERSYLHQDTLTE